ncbi:MAG: Ig-like domain-containing protein, partial [Planctomycetota bacterium]
MKRLRQLFQRDTKLGLVGKRSPGRADRTRRNRVGGKHSLTTEALEKRELLAADLGVENVDSSLHHNPMLAADVNGDYRVTPLDALMVINRLSSDSAEAEDTGDPSDPFADLTYYDVNGDQRLTALDALTVINSLTAEGETGMELVELQLRAVSDPLGEPADASNQLSSVDVGEVFFLQVAYDDLRMNTTDILGNTIFNELGAFQLLVDVFGETEGVLQPALNERQAFTIDSSITTTSFTGIEISQPGQTTFVSNATTVPEIDDALGEALESFGYTTSQFQVIELDLDSSNNVLTGVQFIGTDLLGQDQGDITINFIESGGAPDVPVSATYFDADDPNSIEAILAQSVILESPSYDTENEDNTNYFQRNSFRGSATRNPSTQAVTALSNVGGFGDSSFVSPGGIPRLTEINDVPQVMQSPFVAFSIPVVLTQAVQDFDISVRPAQNSEGNQISEAVLLFDGTGSDDNVNLDSGQILLDADATVTLSTTTAANVAPVANNDDASTNSALATDQDTQLTFASSILLANDTDVDDDASALSIANIAMTSGQGGTVMVDGANIVYNPPTGFTGTDTFTYSIQDDDLAESNTATVSITVNVVTGPIEAGNGAVSAPEEGASNNFDLNNLITNGPATTFGLVTDGSNGTAAIDSNTGILVYTPTSSVEGPETDTIVYSATRDGVTDEGTISITITAVNDAPVAVNDDQTTNSALSTPQETALSFAASILLANDTDVDDDASALSIDSIDTASAQGGVVSFDGTDVSYTPPAGFTGTDTFTYTIEDDDNAESNSATVSITVTPLVLDDLVAGNGTINAVEDNVGGPFTLDLATLVTGGAGTLSYIAGDSFFGTTSE